jgi:hypothetical protein
MFSFLFFSCLYLCVLPCICIIHDVLLFFCFSVFFCFFFVLVLASIIETSTWCGTSQAGYSTTDVGMGFIGIQLQDFYENVKTSVCGNTADAIIWPQNQEMFPVCPRAGVCSLLTDVLVCTRTGGGMQCLFLFSSFCFTFRCCVFLIVAVALAANLEYFPFRFTSYASLCLICMQAM